MDRWKKGHERTGFPLAEVCMAPAVVAGLGTDAFAKDVKNNILPQRTARVTDAKGNITTVSPLGALIGMFVALI